MRRSEKTFTQTRAVIHVEEPYHGMPLHHPGITSQVCNSGMGPDAICFDPVLPRPRNTECEGTDMTKLNLINLGLIALLLAMLAAHAAGAGPAVWPEPVVLPFISS